jgi:hypothetical protein
LRTEYDNTTREIYPEVTLDWCIKKRLARVSFLLASSRWGVTRPRRHPQQFRQSRYQFHFG